VPSWAFPLSETALRLVDGKNYAVLATVNADGSRQTSVVWVGRDCGDLLFSTVEGLVKHRNMLRDPGVSVTVIDSRDPENYVELRGRVSMTLAIPASQCTNKGTLNLYGLNTRLAR
jgi:PPOX class probable F420-dependent enzyme